MLNAELVDDPVYDGVELQWFDDDRHGRGMLVFLSRREDRRVDYYQQRGVTLDSSGYNLGAGTRSWTVIDFDVARLDVADDGVDAEVRFRDIDGRVIEVRVHDRDGRVRRRGGLLAPVSAGIENPSSLLLVWMPAFDLVRRTDTPPMIRIGGRDAQIGRLPGARLHGRHLIKYAAPVLAAEVNQVHAGPRTAMTAAVQSQCWNAERLTTISVQEGGYEAWLILDPGLPTRSALAKAVEEGRWHVEVDGARLTGGTWSGVGSGTGATLALEVDERWQPGPMPWLMRVVTTVVPVFRRWPTTYQWRCDIRLDETPAMGGRWQRTGSTAADDSYRRATQGTR